MDALLYISFDSTRTWISFFVQAALSKPPDSCVALGFFHVWRGKKWLLHLQRRPDRSARFAPAVTQKNLLFYIMGFFYRRRRCSAVYK